MSHSYLLTYLITLLPLPVWATLGVHRRHRRTGRPGEAGTRPASAEKEHRRQRQHAGDAATAEEDRRKAVEGDDDVLRQLNELTLTASADDDEIQRTTEWARPRGGDGVDDDTVKRAKRTALIGTTVGGKCEQHAAGECRHVVAATFDQQWFNFV